MYAPHFAAALAIKGRAREAPLWAPLIGAFIPDLLWIALARIGIEPAQASNFYDDWSHSLVSVAMLATLFCISFSPEGQIGFRRDLAGRVLAFSARFSGSPEAASVGTFDWNLSGMGSVGVGFTTRMVGRNQRLVVASGCSVGATARLCDCSAQE